MRGRQVKSGRKESVRNDCRISWAADGLEFGDTLFDRRKRRKRGVGFSLIPVVTVIKEEAAGNLRDLACLRPSVRRCKSTSMNRIVLGTLCGIAFGVLDGLMVVFGKQPDKSTGMLLQAFFSRFAIGFLAANVSLRMHPALSGALVGLLVSLPDAFAMKSYVGILGTGLVFGALAGWAAKMWAT